MSSELLFSGIQLERNLRIWCSGIIVPSHGTDRGSIPRMRIFFISVKYFASFFFENCLSNTACPDLPNSMTSLQENITHHLENLIPKSHQPSKTSIADLCGGSTKSRRPR
jgi:hypothetical protein